VTLEWRELATGRLHASRVYEFDQFVGTDRSFKAGTRLLDSRFDRGLRPSPSVIRTSPSVMRSGSVATYLGYNELLKVSNSAQSIREAETKFSLGSMLDSFLSYVPWLAERLNESQIRVGIWDADSGQFLWRAREQSQDGSYIRITSSEDHHFLVVDELRDGMHTISMIELPLKLNSPWWSRSAGLLIAALVLFARRRRQSLPVA
jgi:hypothetical protein